MWAWRSAKGQLWAVGASLVVLPGPPALAASSWGETREASRTAAPQAEELEASQSPALDEVDLDALLADVNQAAGAEAGETDESGESWLTRSLLPTLQRLGSAESRARLRDDLARRFDEGRARLTLRAADLLERVLTGSLGERARLAALQALAVAVTLLLSVRLLRGRGDVAVCIEYPAELRGTFNVRLRKRRPHARGSGRITTPGAAARAKHLAGAGSPTEHPMVSRETQFRDVRARRYWVTVDGFLQSAESEEVVATHCDERQVRVRRRRTVRAEFDFHPKECSVEVKVLWDGRPVPEAMVALYGVPYSLRYARGGPVRIGLGHGSHILVIGCGDRVAEYALEISSFRPECAVVDLGVREQVVFTGCPPAVEPYVLGDVAAAARALERDGQVETAQLLLARLHQERDQKEAAARHFEAAGHVLEAADLRAALSQFAQAAKLFESAGEYARAATMHLQADDPLRAGEAYERSKQYDSAVQCFRQAGDVAKWVEALERCGDPFEAAKVATDHGDSARAIRSLQQVTKNDPYYSDAIQLLIDAYEREGHPDLAARKLEELVEVQGDEGGSLEELDRLARLLDESNELERALEVLEEIRARDVSYPHVASRIEDLRKRRSAQATAPSTAGSGAAVGAFVSEARYDILEELGRGGMGVVFKARDRRLGRTVALKRLTESLREHPKAVELFLREARSAAALNHPNIVTLYDAGQEGETYYITMEFLEGSPLQKILRSRGKLKPCDVAKLGVQVAGGLAYAHEQRIVHRDIKTANLFFTQKNVVKIMDFGLAKMVEEVRRSSTLIGGTPYYMAPEQSMGQAVDHRADLYALGVTFFELLTGRLPFVDGDVAFHHRHTPPPDPQKLEAGVPAEFAELILQLLVKDPEERVASAADVRDRLQPIAR